VENGLGLATNVVLKLAEPYLDAGRTLTTDNFYTRLPLARALLRQKTHLVGTLRDNRKGLPENVRKNKLSKGDIVSRHSKDGIVVLKWHDKRDVFMLTTQHTDAIVATGKKDRQGNDITKPEAVI